MDTSELEKILKQLIILPQETEWVEFKEAKNSYDFDKLGKYFSALSNEANLKNQPSGWLVFGVENTHRTIIGSNYRKSPGELDKLKQELACQTNGRITFTEIHTLNLSEGRVILFEIPPAPKGIPTAWQGHFYGREGESLAALAINEIEAIRKQKPTDDWSAAVVPQASIQDLDEQAIGFARSQYQQKNPRIAEEIIQWDVNKFLDMCV